MHAQQCPDRVLKPYAWFAFLNPNLNEIPLDMVGDKAVATFEAMSPSIWF
jgi:hypothetical protein